MKRNQIFLPLLKKKKLPFPTSEESNVNKIKSIQSSLNQSNQRKKLALSHVRRIKCSNSGHRGQNWGGKEIKFVLPLIFKKKLKLKGAKTNQICSATL
jgi:hypothetical protein